jgi:hypothetical protein
MKIISGIFGGDSEKKPEKKKEGSSAVAERLSSLLEADNTKLSAITHQHSASSMEPAAETPFAAARPVSPPPSIPMKAKETAPAQAQVHAATDSIARAAREAVDKLQAAQQEMEASFRTRAEDYQKMLVKLASSALQRSGFQQRVIKAAADELEEMVKGHLGRAARQIREQVEAAQALLDERVRGVPAAASAGPNLGQEAASGALASIMEATEEAVARLAATQKDIEERFQAQAQDFEKRVVEAAAEKVGHTGLSTQLLEQATKELEQSAKEMSERSARETREQAEGLMGELRASNEKLLEEFRHQLEAAARPALEEQIRAARQEAESAMGSVTQAVEQALGKLASTQREIETGFEARANEYQKRLVDAAMEELERKGVSGTLVEQTTAAIERAAGELLMRSTQDLRRQAEAARKVLDDELRATRESILAEMRAQISSAVKPEMNEAAMAAAKQAAGQAEAARREAERAMGSVTQAVEQALAKLAATQKEIETGFEARADEYQKRLVDAATEELGRKGISGQLTEQAAEKLESVAQELVARSAEELRRQAETARTGLDDALNAKRESFLAETRAQLSQAAEPARQQAEAAAQTLTEAAEQALARLTSTQRQIEGEFKKKSQEYQKRLVDAATEELERQGVSQRLVQGASKELERSAGELLVRSAGELRRQAETARGALDEQLRVARESFVIEVRQRLANAAQPTLEQHIEAVRKNAQSAVDSLTQASQQAMAALGKTQRELELNFKSEAKNHQQHLVEAAAEELKRQGISQQIIQAAVADLERATREFVDRSTQELRQQAVATLAAVEQQLRSKTEVLIADTHEEIAGLIRKPREALQKMLNDALARVVEQLRAEQMELVRKEQAPLRRQLIYLDALTQEERARVPRPTFSGKELRSAGLLAAAALFAMVMVGWAAYFATRPAAQFRNDPPTAFIEQNQNWGPKRRGKEADLAKAYWAAGLRDVENNNYSFGAQLPEDPPPDFTVDDKSLPDSTAARARYWEKFRESWADPNSWQSGPSSQSEWVETKANWVQGTLKRMPMSYAIEYNLMKLLDKFQVWWFSHGDS